MTYIRGMRPCKVFAKALEVIRASDGEITPMWLQKSAQVDKKHSWWALQIAVRKGLLTRTGYGVYRRPAPTAGAA